MTFRGTRCLNNKYRCDDYVHCIGGEDEDGCDYCTEEKFQCDGVIHCHDKSDEKNCSSCKHEKFLCNDSTCIEQYHRCDGEIHCLDRSDEYGCEICPQERPFACKINKNGLIKCMTYCSMQSQCEDASIKEQLEAKSMCDGISMDDLHVCR